MRGRSSEPRQGILQGVGFLRLFTMIMIIISNSLFVIVIIIYLFLFFVFFWGVV